MILFYLFHAISAAVDLVSDLLALDHMPISHASQIVSSISRLILDVTLAWIGGSLPIREALPGPNVATEKDVRAAAVSDIYSLTWLS